MRGLTSYNAIDSVDFANAKKVEARIFFYERRNKRKQRRATLLQYSKTLADLKNREALERKDQKATDAEFTNALNKLKPEAYDVM